MNKSEDTARAVAELGRIDAVPTLLKVVCEMTGMRLSAVIRVTGGVWTALAIRDELCLGVAPGEVLCSSTPPFKSHIAVPIILGNGCYFGSLCALDTHAVKVCEPRITSMFNDFAALIASQLHHQSVREQEKAALLDERAAGELREEFIAILGHDLRNPLHAIYASSDILQRQLVSPAHVQIAARITTYARRMSSLIDDVLDLARGRLGGGIGLELTEVENINVGLNTVVQELRDAQPDRQILADIGVSRAVRCDLGRLQQVASNLLANALTHGLPYSPIRFTASDDGQNLVLEVWNAGTPIPAESLSKIFEPFWRHAASASRNGLGLGLHICAQIVSAHDGHISVTSTAEDGTKFTARLPLGMAPPAATLHIIEAADPPMAASRQVQI